MPLKTIGSCISVGGALMGPGMERKVTETTREMWRHMPEFTHWLNPSSSLRPISHCDSQYSCVRKKIERNPCWVEIIWFLCWIRNPWTLRFIKHLEASSTESARNHQKTKTQENASFHWFCLLHLYSVVTAGWGDIHLGYMERHFQGMWLCWRSYFRRKSEDSGMALTSEHKTPTADSVVLVPKIEYTWK